jgi:hypothetical protein
MAKCSECCAIGGDLNLLIQMKHVYQNWNEKCADQLPNSVPKNIVYPEVLLN